MRRQVRLEREAAAILARLAPVPKRKVRAALKALAGDPSSLDIKELGVPQRQSPVWRVRLGDLRIVYDLHGGHVRVLRIFHRSQGYTWLDP